MSTLFNWEANLTPVGDELRTIQCALERRERLDQVLRWFRVCAGCHGVWPPIDLFCADCWATLLTHSRGETHWHSTETSEYPFPVRTLFTWQGDAERILRAMLRGLKGGLSFAAALQLIERLALNGANPLEAPIFVHPPSRTGRRDHAWLLAQLLARQWQFATGPALSLRFTEQHLLTAQKSKSAADRSLLRYQSLENLSKSRSFVFVDDIITTGSTAMAAFMALGEPERFSVFAIVSRPKRRAQLAGKSGIW